MYKLTHLLLDQSLFFYNKHNYYIRYLQSIQTYELSVSKLKMMINCIC